jgi:hypothetical protein
MNEKALTGFGGGFMPISYANLTDPAYNQRVRTG